MEIVRDGFSFGDEQWQHTFGFDGDYIILILQNPFDCQKPF